jgi:hypothetical protein
LTSQASTLALTTCSLADLAAAVRRAVATIGHDANKRYGTRKVFLAAVHAALGARARSISRHSSGAWSQRTELVYSCWRALT